MNGEPMTPAKLPMQPVILDRNGHPRFRANKIVDHVVLHAGEFVIRQGAPDLIGRLDLTKLGWWCDETDVPQEDQEQFAQLMGYSVSGYHELSYVSEASCARATEKARELTVPAGTPRFAAYNEHLGGWLVDSGVGGTFSFNVDDACWWESFDAAMDELVECELVTVERSPSRRPAVPSGWTILRVR